MKKCEEARKIELKNKMGYSERLVRNVLLASFAIVVVASYYAFVKESSEVWGYVLDVIKYLTPSTVGFFIWKARGENLIKIRSNPDFNLQKYAQQILEEVEEDVFQEYEEETKNLHKGDNIY